jgi:hypothetical protein
VKDNAEQVIKNNQPCLAKKSGQDFLPDRASFPRRAALIFLLSRADFPFV